uniref:Uncharacterized protein n=1 Tax=Rhizophora mucronata TaxID=61149 RepID=A0A2P2QBI7_RHIMU
MPSGCQSSMRYLDAIVYEVSHNLEAGTVLFLFLNLLPIN